MVASKTKIAIVGAGGRGLNSYAGYIRSHPEENAEIVAVVDPKPDRRHLAKQMFPSLPEKMVLKDWESFIGLGKVADAAIIATLEGLHAPIAVACADLGYHILLEKPMAPTADECRQIVRRVQEAGVILAVCHVLRYTPFYQKIKSIIDSGVLGEVMHVQHVEDVAYWHFSHSYVRGHYSDTARTSFSLLSKSCHDIDIIRFLMGRRCVRAHSFGGLKHFVRANKPAEAGEAVRCTECPYEPKCPYSAAKIYVRDGANIGADAFGGKVLTYDFSKEGVTKAIKEGKMGLCVYECSNDAADHQVVNLLYEGGQTAAFTMSTFTEGGRKTSVLGTRAVLRGDMNAGTCRWYDFLTDKWHDESLSRVRGDLSDGHGGGDQAMVSQWLAAVRTGDQSKIITGPDETLETHLTVFAAEQSRLDGDVKAVDY